MSKHKHNPFRNPDSITEDTEQTENKEDVKQEENNTQDSELQEKYDALNQQYLIKICYLFNIFAAFFNAYLFFMAIALVMVIYMLGAESIQTYEDFLRFVFYALTFIFLVLIYFGITIISLNGLSKIRNEYEVNLFEKFTVLIFFITTIPIYLIILLKGGISLLAFLTSFVIDIFIPINTFII